MQNTRESVLTISSPLQASTFFDRLSGRSGDTEPEFQQTSMRQDHRYNATTWQNESGLQGPQGRTSFKKLAFLIHL